MNRRIPHSIQSFSNSPLTPKHSFIDAMLKNSFDNYSNKHIEYRTFLSNHSTHFVVAFAGLDLKLNVWNDTESGPIRKYCTWYEKRLEPMSEADSTILSQVKGNEAIMWDKLHKIVSTKIDVHTEYATVLQYLMDKEGVHGLDDWKVKHTSKGLLNKYFPRLIQGLSGAAYHGLIELGWRIEGGFNLSPALAYSVVRGLDLGKCTPNQELDDPHIDPMALLKKVSTDSRVDHLFDGVSGFQSEMQEFSNHTEILDDYDIKLDENMTYEQLQEWCESLNEILYTIFTKSEAKGDFFVLHAITSLHAMRYVLGHLDNPEDRFDLVRHYWRSIVAAYCVLGRPQIQPDTQNDVPSDWSEAIKHAKKAEEIDEHWYKLFYVSILTSERRPDLLPLMREAVQLYYECVKKEEE